MIRPRAISTADPFVGCIVESLSMYFVLRLKGDKTKGKLVSFLILDFFKALIVSFCLSTIFHVHNCNKIGTHLGAHGVEEVLGICNYFEWSGIY